MTKEVFPVLGMSCAACALHVEKALKRSQGVEHATVNFADGTAHVVFNPSQCSPASLRRAVQQAGYDLLLESDHTMADTLRQKSFVRLKWRTMGAFFCWAAIMIVSMSMEHSLLTGIVQMLFAAVAVFVFGRQFIVNAVRQLLRGTSNMDTLVALSTSVAWGMSTIDLFFPKIVSPHLYFESAAGIVAFIMLGRMLEERAKRGTQAAIRSLMGLRPSVVSVKNAEGRYETRQLSAVAVGDVLLAAAGERLAADGVATHEGAKVDESMLTGEPEMVVKHDGDKVFAGTRNGATALEYRVERTGADTALERIVAMMREAEGSRPHVQRMVDKVAAVFVPAMVGVSLLTLVAWLLVGGTDNLQRGLLAALSVLVIACPCALGLATPTALMVAIGQGVRHGILIKGAEALETACYIDTVVFDKTGTLTEGGFDGRFDHDTKTDRMKPTSPDAVAELSRRGIATLMLTGDKAERAERVARAAGVTSFVAEALPEQKIESVRQLQSNGHKVAMVGDGINDSAALAAADLSVAMGQGTDVAMQAAMVTIMSGELTKIPQLIDLSRHTVNTIRQNLFWAFAYNLVAVPVAAFGLVSPMVGSICMALSSVSVVTNSLRLRRAKLWNASTSQTTVTLEPIKEIRTMTKKTYVVKGMMCQNCRKHVEHALASIEGVDHVNVVLETGEADVTFSGEPIPLVKLQQIILDEAGDYEIAEK